MSPGSDVGASITSTEVASQARPAEPGQESAGGISWREVRILYLREMRAALRERAIVVNSILLPLLLYPLILWAAFAAISYVQGQSGDRLSRVAVKQWPSDQPALKRAFEIARDMRLLSPPASAEEGARKVRSGEIEAIVDFQALEDTNGSHGKMAGDFETRILFDSSKEFSAEAEHRVRDLVDSYKQRFLKRQAKAGGISASEWQGFYLTSVNVASRKQVGAMVLGLMLPLMFVVMVAMGCFFPAVDATAGERERQTWETLMSTAASRPSIVTAKYLYVATLGGAAGALNLLAFTATIKPIFAPLLKQGGGELDFAVPLAALPLTFLAGVLLAGFVAAGMMIFASFARTFKEGQAMITPFYLCILLPVMFLQTPGLNFSTGLAFIPVVNLTLMVRAALGGSFPVLPILITVLVSTLFIAANLRLAVYVLRFEDVVVGSYGGSLPRFLRERFFRSVQPRSTRKWVRPPPASQ